MHYEHYERGVEVVRRPWQWRTEVYSPKLGRRLTLFTRAAHDVWLLLESDPAPRAGKSATRFDNN